VFSWTDAQFPLTGRFRLREHPVVTVVGKAFYDIDHSGNDTVVNRRNYDGSLAIWEIHPVMKISLASPDIPPVAATSTPRADSVPQSAVTNPAAATGEQFVTLTRAVTVQVSHGSAVLQPGMKLPVLSRDSTTVDVRYMDARYTIPISSTDLR
ncbi:MAG TPA: hypothetical protein VFA58_03140, partial [Chthoniobacterales bacterium]|nr:hypothetical protein [Chthoniobacterales bacterium]